MAFTNCFKYLNAEFINTNDKTFIQISFKDDINRYIMVIQSGDVDVLVETAMNVEGIVTVISKTPVQSTHVPRNPEGLVCFKNIDFNVIEFPPRFISLPHSTNDTTSVCPDDILRAIIHQWFGIHIGVWTGNAYTAILASEKMPFGKQSLQPIFFEIEKLVNVTQMPTDFMLVTQSLNALQETFLNKGDREWWTLYLSLLNCYIDNQSKRVLPLFTEQQLMQSTWTCDSQMNLCEICLTNKHDLGVLFIRNRNIKYVSSMLTCFECFIANQNGINDSSYKLCSNWLPVFNSLLGLVLFHKSGNSKVIKEVIIYLLCKEFLNEKELFIVENLLYIFKSFYIGLDCAAMNLYQIIEGNENLICENAKYVQRATKTTGTLKERLAFAYSRK